MHKNKIVIVGGGAAGYFTALNLSEKVKESEITLLEKSNKVLSKVKVSGGGRCNVTNGRQSPSELHPFYPRGGKKLYPVFAQFSTGHMRQWLSDRGVDTKEEEDGRVFPVTNDSQTIIDCFLKLAQKNGIQANKGEGLMELSRSEKGWTVSTSKGTYNAHQVVIATGSSPQMWKLLEKLGLKLVPAVPSLFTFNIKDERIQGLQGLSFDHVQVKVVGSKLSEEGPMLITHWGMSGPAILKLSSVGAFDLHDKTYKFELLINYLSGLSESEVRQQWNQYKSEHPNRLLINYPLWNLPKRFWQSLTAYCGIEAHQTYGETAKKTANKLLEELMQGRYKVEGKSTFKDEFVTAGGVALEEINLTDFSAKRFPGLYFAGEVLNIDALTGGFNFQACWSAGWLISEAISKSNT